MLVMSKDDKICQHLYELYFWDMRKKDRITFDDHKEYNWLKWDKDIYRYQSVNGKDRLVYDGWSAEGSIATFDINNDGKEEAVLFEKWSLGGNLFEQLSFLPVHYYDKFKTKVYTKDLPDKYPKFPPSPYPLKEFPVQMVSDGGPLGPRPRTIDLGRWSYVRPMKVGTTYLLSVFSSMWQGRPYPPLEQTNLISIIKYNDKNETQDICYFVRANLWKNGSYPQMKK